MDVKKITKAKLLSLSIIAAFTAITISYFNDSSTESFDSVRASSTANKFESETASVTEESQQVTTSHILGYESKYGALPDSLSGTTLFNALQADDEGHLLLSEDIKDLFDYFLSTITEEELDLIMLRVNEYLTHNLQEPALSESKAILRQYIEFKSSLLGLEQEMAEDLAQLSQQDKRNGGYLNFLRNQLNQRNALRAEHLDPALHEVFYAEEERYDEYTYSRLLITSDKSLSADERHERVSALQSTLPEDVRQSIRETQITDELKMRTEQVLADGGDHEQVRELRREMFGEEAVQRFDELDKKRALWKSRVDDYLIQRERILNNQGLANEERTVQVDALRGSLFEENEQRKAIRAERDTDA